MSYLDELRESFETFRALGGYMLPLAGVGDVKPEDKDVYRRAKEPVTRGQPDDPVKWGATNDLDAILTYGKERPGRWWGVTFPEGGVVTIDIDPKHPYQGTQIAGMMGLEDVLRGYGSVWRTTPRGGVHVTFAYTLDTGTELKNWGGWAEVYDDETLAAKIDIRLDGLGFTVCPPSSGYEFIRITPGPAIRWEQVLDRLKKTRGIRIHPKKSGKKKRKARKRQVAPGGAVINIRPGTIPPPVLAVLSFVDTQDRQGLVDYLQVYFQVPPEEKPTMEAVRPREGAGTIDLDQDYVEGGRYNALLQGRLGMWWFLGYDDQLLEDAIRAIVDFVGDEWRPERLQEITQVRDRTLADSQAIPRVLLVDDHHVSREALTRGLGGYYKQAATSGVVNGLVRLKANKPTTATKEANRKRPLPVEEVFATDCDLDGEGRRMIAQAIEHGLVWSPESSDGSWSRHDIASGRFVAELVDGSLPIPKIMPEMALGGTLAAALQGQPSFAHVDQFGVDARVQVVDGLPTDLWVCNPPVDDQGNRRPDGHIWRRVNRDLLQLTIKANLGRVIGWNMKEVAADDPRVDYAQLLGVAQEGVDKNGNPVVQIPVPVHRPRPSKDVVEASLFEFIPHVDTDLGDQYLVLRDGVCVEFRPDGRKTTARVYDGPRKEWLVTTRWDTALEDVEATSETGELFDTIVTLVGSEETARKLVAVFARYLAGLARETGIAVVLYGPAGDGKSTLVEALRRAFPAGTTHVLSQDSLVENGREHYDLANLVEKRLAVVDDAPSKKSITTSVFKQLVQGDMMTVRQIRRQPVVFRPNAGLVFTANSLPTATIYGDDGIRRRMWAVPTSGIRHQTDEPREAIITRLQRGWPGLLWRAVLEGWEVPTIDEVLESNAGDQLSTDIAQATLELLGFDDDDTLRKFVALASTGALAYHRGVNRHRLPFDIDLEDEGFTLVPASTFKRALKEAVGKAHSPGDIQTVVERVKDIVHAAALELDATPQDALDARRAVAIDGRVQYKNQRYRKPVLVSTSSPILTQGAEVIDLDSHRPDPDDCTF